MNQDICFTHHGGNAESVSANLCTDKERDRARILSHLRSVGEATCDEVEIALNIKHQTCSARMSEMKRDGMIVPGQRKRTSSGCWAQAWLATFGF
jgi:predicted transcriptional regulator